MGGSCWTLVEDVSVDGGEVSSRCLFYCGDTSTGRRCEHQMLDTGDLVFYRGVTLIPMSSYREALVFYR